MSRTRKRGRTMALTLRLLGRLPASWAAALGGFLGWLVAITPIPLASARRLVLINLLACYPFLSWPECKRLARRSLVETGRTLAEFATVWVQPVTRSLARVTEIRGLELLQHAMAGERPVLILALHQSSWELINLLLGRQGPAVVMYQPDRNEAVTELVRHARERTGCRLVPANAAGVKVALETLRDGGTLAILADHNPGLKNNPLVPFFGHPVPTPALIAKLVQRYRPQVFFTSCYRGRGVRDVRIYFEPAPEVEAGEDAYAILLAVNRGLEECINRSPAQYHWPYKRFRDGPEGRRQWYRQSRRILRRARRDPDRESLGLASPAAPEGEQRGH